MEFLTLREAQVKRGDVIFKRSALSSLKRGSRILAIGVGGIIFLHFVTDLPFVMTAIFGLFLVPLVLQMLYSFIKALRSRNWFVVLNPNRVLIKYRSYLRNDFPPDEELVLELPMSDIEAVQKTTRRMNYRRPGSIGWSSQTYLDLHVAPEGLEELQERLDAQIPEADISRVKIADHHYPVSVLEDGIIRLEWRTSNTKIAPGIDTAIKLFRRQVSILAANIEKVILTDPELTDEEELNAQILELAGSGQRIKAARLAMTLYDFDIEEAKEYVDNLSRRPEEMNEAHSDEKIIALIKDGRMIEAVKEARAVYNIGLKEAKEYVEDLQKRI